MPIFDTVSAQITAAMKSKDERRLAALRSVRAAFLTEMKKDNAQSLSDEVCVQLVRKLEKQRKESIEAFEAAGRADRAADEKAELAVLAELLPSLADAATTRRWVQEAIASTGASQPGDVGRVMGAVMKAHRGDIDGVLAKEIAGELLSG